MRSDVAVADVADLFEPLAEERGVSLNCSTEREVWTNRDEGRLRQMVGNLVDNAIKYTPNGGRVDVILTTRNGTAEGGRAKHWRRNSAGALAAHI